MELLLQDLILKKEKILIGSIKNEYYLISIRQGKWVTIKSILKELTKLYSLKIYGKTKLMSCSLPQFDEIEAKKAVIEYIDYFCERAIKCDLSGDTVDH